MTNSATNINGTIDLTSQDSTLETYGDKSGVDQSLILKTIAGKLQLFFGELIKCFRVTEQIIFVRFCATHWN